MGVHERGLEGDVGRLCDGLIPYIDKRGDFPRHTLRRRCLEEDFGFAECIHAHDADGSLAKIAVPDSARGVCEQRTVPFAEKPRRKRRIPVLADV